MKVYIINPTYNEQENIKKLVPAIAKLNTGDEIINLIVDDNSPDGTGNLAEKLSQKYPVQVIHRKGNMGIGSAYLKGYEYALRRSADAIIMMDADFSHDPKVIPKMIKEAKNGFNVVIGSRYIPGGSIPNWPWYRHFMSSGANKFSKLMLGLKTRDVTTGFRLLTRRALESIPLHKIKSSGYSFMEELIYYCEKKKLKVKEIPITFRDRSKGKSKLSRMEIVKFFITILGLKLR